MGDVDFSNLGREIGDKIEQFINSKEMKELQDSIRNTVEAKMEDVRKSAQDAADYVNKNMEAQKDNISKKINSKNWNIVSEKERGSYRPDRKSVV